MRIIETHEDKEKKIRRNQLIMGVILILLMIFSTIGFAFSSNISGSVVEEVEYNNIEFNRESTVGYWTFDVQGQEYITFYNAKEFAVRDLNGYILVFSEIQE